MYLKEIEMMKSRKFFICVAVLGIVVPLVFLSQTIGQDSSYRKGQKRLVPRFRADALGQQPTSEYQNSSVSPDLLQKDRIDTLEQGCRRLDSRGVLPNSVTASQLSHILVDDTYKIMFCYIPKVACTNIKRVFLLLTGKMNTTNPLDISSSDVHVTYDKYLTYLSQYDTNEIYHRIKTYQKIIFVREPLERLLSAYRNKFMEKREYFHHRFGRRIIRKYRKNPSASSLQKGNDVQFIEFVKYLTDKDTMRIEGYNEHWAHYSGLCHPCLVKYDYIGKYETLDQDVDQVLKILDMDNTIKFPARGATYKGKKTKDIMADFYGTIPPKYLASLWKIYVNDYKLFGYPYPKVLQQFLPA